MRLTRDEAQLDTELACSAAQRRGGPSYSHSYFVPQHDGRGQEVMDLCVAERNGERVSGFVVASYSLPGLLDQLTPQSQLPAHDLLFVEADGTRLAHGRLHVGAGIYRANQLIDLPGTTMQLRVDSAATRPGLVPDLVTSLVIGLSLTLFGVVVLLARDVRRRARAEGALADGDRDLLPGAALLKKALLPGPSVYRATWPLWQLRRGLPYFFNLIRGWAYSERMTHRHGAWPDGLHWMATSVHAVPPQLGTVPSTKQDRPAALAG